MRLEAKRLGVVEVEVFRWLILGRHGLQLNITRTKIT